MGRDEDMVYFWSDGCYATKRYKDSYLRDQIIQIELHKERVRLEETDRRANQSRRDKILTHPGIDCCDSCYGEYIDNYMGGGVMMDGYCCCLDNHISGIVYPLDDARYRPMYPPVNGKVPEIFDKWGPKTQERYLKRFKDELSADS